MQLYLNFKRRSVQGLSTGMFLMAIMGNLTYGTSLLLRPLSMDYFVSKLPWLVPVPFILPLRLRVTALVIRTKPSASSTPFGVNPRLP